MNLAFACRVLHQPSLLRRSSNWVGVPKSGFTGKEAQAVFAALNRIRDVLLCPEAERGLPGRVPWIGPVRPEIGSTAASFQGLLAGLRGGALAPASFVSFGAGAHTLNQFLGEFQDLLGLVRERTLASH